MKISRLINKSEIIYYLFYCFWIIVLLPKPAQLVLLFAVSLYLIGLKKEIKRDWFIDTQYLVLAIYGISIIYNLFISDHDIVRVFAAFNTFMITFTALMLYRVYSSVEIDGRRIGKSCLINLGILALILIIYIISPNKEGLSILGHAISLDDLLYNEATTRFVGLFAYSNLLGLFSLVSFPFIIEWLKDKKRFFFYSIGIILLNFLFSYYANSRSGQLIIIMLLCGFVFTYILTKLQIEQRKIFVIIVITLVLIIGILSWQYVYFKLSDMLLARAGSNSSRLTIYESSIKLVLERSPVIGMGIKDMLSTLPYPYGSHSSYIGYFYKAGILGGIIYLCSFMIYAYKLFKWKKRDIGDYTLFICIMLMLIWMILEDLDGANWGICYAFILMGYTSCKSNEKYFNPPSEMGEQTKQRRCIEC